MGEPERRSQAGADHQRGCTGLKRSRLKGEHLRQVKGTSARSFVGSCLALSEKLPIERATNSGTLAALAAMHHQRVRRPSLMRRASSCRHQHSVCCALR